MGWVNLWRWDVPRPLVGRITNRGRRLTNRGVVVDSPPLAIIVLVWHLFILMDVVGPPCFGRSLFLHLFPLRYGRRRCLINCVIFIGPHILLVIFLCCVRRRIDSIREQHHP